jgi:hypothetical protein
VPAGATTAEIHVVVIGDLVAEPHESFVVSLSSPEHAVLGSSATATVTIRDDEPVAVRVQSPSVTEGDGGATTPAEFLVSVDPLPAGTTVSVPWSIEAGTARFPGDEGITDPDVLPGDGVVELDASVLQAAVVASVVGDDLTEDLAVETFSLRLGAVTASDGRPVVVVDTRPATILDDDPADSAPVVSAGSDSGGPEGSAVPLEALVADDGPVALTWSTDAPGCVVADPSSAVTSITCADDVTALVTLTGDDGVNPAVTDEVTVTVTNVDPVIGSAAYVDGVVVVAFADPGADTHTCTVDAGDGSDPVIVAAATTPCSVPHAYGPGNHVAQVTVVDDDGGVVSASIEVVVSAGYAWDGFFQPVDNDALNVVQAGRAIPVKFSLGGDHGLDIFAGGSPTSVPVACDTGARLDTVEETVTAGGSSLTYDAATGRYHYVWKTSKAWSGQCRTLVVTLLDGSTHTATFRFR